jgi:hypothetical protein
MTFPKSLLIALCSLIPAVSGAQGKIENQASHISTSTDTPAIITLSCGMSVGKNPYALNTGYCGLLMIPLANGINSTIDTIYVVGRPSDFTSTPAAFYCKIDAGNPKYSKFLHLLDIADEYLKFQVTVSSADPAQICIDIPQYGKSSSYGSLW